MRETKRARLASGSSWAGPRRILRARRRYVHLATNRGRAKIAVIVGSFSFERHGIGAVRRIDSTGAFLGDIRRRTSITLMLRFNLYSAPFAKSEETRSGSLLQHFGAILRAS